MHSGLMQSIQDCQDVWTDQDLVCAGEGWDGVFTSTCAPVEIRGVVDGQEFYFASRYDSWTFCVATGEGTPKDVFTGDVNGFYVRGDYSDIAPGWAGFISRERALVQLLAGINTFRGLDWDAEYIHHMTTLPAPSGDVSVVFFAKEPRAFFWERLESGVYEASQLTEAA